MLTVPIPRRRMSLLIFALSMCFALAASPAYAQEGPTSPIDPPEPGGTPAPPSATIHIVQRGENLFRIALRYGTTVEDIALANGIPDSTVIDVGQRLLIPNADPGAPGVPRTYTVAPGDSLVNLAARFGTTAQDIAIRNFITNPAQLFVGDQLALLEGSADEDGGIKSGWVHHVAPGENIYRIALHYSVPVAAILAVNRLAQPTALAPGQRLIIPGPPDGPEPVDLPLPLVGASLRPAVTEQGRTVVLTLTSAVPARVEGAFLGRALIVFSDESRTQHAAIIGVPALQPPGVYPLEVRITDETGAPTNLTRPVAVVDGGYALETITLADSQADLLNTAITEPEEQRVNQIVSVVSAARYFDGPLGLPCPAPVTSQFGTRRSYNGEAFNRVHSGADFAGAPGAEIYAPAAGIVVLAETLNVRGNATIIDHGWGIFTGYWHQQNINVRVGDVVQPGQIIGTVGATGRATGPHLHWELFVGGVQVDPLQWTRMSFP